MPNDGDHGDDVGIQGLVDEIVFPYRVDVQRGIAHEVIARPEPQTIFCNVQSTFVEVFEIAVGE